MSDKNPFFYVISMIHTLVGSYQVDLTGGLCGPQTEQDAELGALSIKIGHNSPSQPKIFLT